MFEIPQVSKEKPIFIRNPYVYVCYMQYLSTMYTYYVFLSHVWYVYACIHALSMICVYMYLCLLVCYVYAMLIVDLLFQLFIFLF